MKIKLFSFMATACFLFTVTTAIAKNKTGNIYSSVKQINRVITDTPYLASAKIYRTGVKDTPYLYINTSASTVYEQVEQFLAGERGSFKVIIDFYSETGRLIRNERYFIKTEEVSVPRTK